MYVIFMQVMEKPDSGRARGTRTLGELGRPETERVGGANPATDPGWLTSAVELLDSFGDRELAIFDHRVFEPIPVPQTLEQVGQTFKITRERIRQIQKKSQGSLSRRLASAEYAPLSATIERVRLDLGSVFSVPELSEFLGVEVDPERLTLPVRMVLWSAGPYQILSGRFVRNGLIEAAVDAIAPGGPTPTESLRPALSELGLRDSVQDGLLAHLPGHRVLQDHLVPWAGSLADKASVVLAVHERLMSADEIQSEIGEGSIRTLKNYLSADDRFIRRGRQTWGLHEWGGEKYDGVAAEMMTELAQSELGWPIERLKRVLADKFGIKASSIEIMSWSHPTFVRDGAWIRLRRADEPYIPESALEEDPNCVMIDDVWAWRHTVDHDTLRGSGRLLPEPFAAHVGLLPKVRVTLDSVVGPVTMTWSAQYPAIGSMRRFTDALEADHGDLLFARIDAGRLEVSITRSQELSDGADLDRLMLWLGQERVEGRWLARCANALGLPSHAQLREVRQLLEARGDREVLRLFEAAVRRESEST